MAQRTRMRHGDQQRLETGSDHAWEFVVAVAFWLVAVVALVFVAAYLAHDAYKTRRREGRR